MTDNIYKGYEAVIGLEVHFELNTNSKIFCGCKTSFGQNPNSHICPVCMGFPGTLPSLNKKVAEYAVKAGLALNCKISNICSFDRKSYFYPDLPKAYQITQHKNPIAKDGYVEIDVQNGKKKIGIVQLHMEEDAGKLIHDKGSLTLADFNRCGIPLIEIVSKPDMRSADEAVSYLKNLRNIILFTGISDCLMSEGSMRADVNISVRKQNSHSYGTRVEVKNINSFMFVKKAIEYEICRQTDLILGGKEVVAETRHFNEQDGKTCSLRKKEGILQYFYFPDPDLPCIEITDKQIEEIRNTLPKMPKEYCCIFETDYGLSEYESTLLTQHPSLCRFFESAANKTQHKKVLCNLVLSEIMRLCKDFNNIEISTDIIAEISSLCANDTISFSASKKLVCALWGNNSIKSAYMFAKENNMLQINDTEILEKELDKATEQNPKCVEDAKGGKTAALKALAGAVMKQTGGAANPIVLNKLIESRFLNK